jgi:hypothetical protein
MDGRAVSSDVVCTHHITRYNTPINNILSTASQLSISQKALGRLPEDGNVTPKHVGAKTHHVTTHSTAIHNILSTAPQLSISQKALGTLPEDGNVMPKHVGATIHN